MGCRWGWVGNSDLKNFNEAPAMNSLQYFYFCDVIWIKINSMIAQKMLLHKFPFSNFFFSTIIFPKTNKWSENYDKIWSNSQHLKYFAMGNNALFYHKLYDKLQIDVHHNQAPVFASFLHPCDLSKHRSEWCILE